MRPLTREWVQKAEGDLAAAGLLAEAAASPDQTCFLAQQAAEKYLKAVLQERDVRFPRVHNLEALAELLDPPLRKLTVSAAELRALSEMAVHTRYPGFFADAEMAARAVATAHAVREACRFELGLSDGE